MRLIISKLKAFLGIPPKICPKCGGEIIARGFEGVNRRYQCLCCQTIVC